MENIEILKDFNNNVSFLTLKANEISNIISSLFPDDKDLVLIKDNIDKLNANIFRIIVVGEFKRGKGKFVYGSYKESVELTENKNEFPYIITTNRELEHYNCGTMTRRTNNAKILKEDYLLINAADAKKHNINNGDLVCVTSARGKVDVKAKITDEVQPGILSSTFHFPEIEMNNITSILILV